MEGVAPTHGHCHCLLSGLLCVCVEACIKMSSMACFAPQHEARVLLMLVLCVKSHSLQQYVHAIASMCCLMPRHGIMQFSLSPLFSNAMQTYAKYAPYQFLAYWRELWRDYEQLVGPFHLLSSDAYHLLTGATQRVPCLLDSSSAGKQSALVTSQAWYLPVHVKDISSTWAIHCPWHQQHIDSTAAVYH